MNAFKLLVIGIIGAIVYVKGFCDIANTKPVVLKERTTIIQGQIDEAMAEINKLK